MNADARLIRGDCLKVLPTLGVGSVDAVVTDPPYGLKFMGQNWDHGIPGVSFWSATFRVLKPGGYLLAFGGPRTFHRLASAIEDAGFVIQDTLCWLYGTGFPKHKSKLKPAWEPIIMAWKPAPRATPLNIDECRVAGPGWSKQDGPSGAGCKTGKFMGVVGLGEPTQANGFRRSTSGRWPANVVLDDEAARLLDEQSGERKSGGKSGASYFQATKAVNCYGDGLCGATPRFSDTGGASRFFYCAKASRRDRGEGNTHPTVKPARLLEWLIRLVSRKGGLILDPFMGSGTTGVACRQAGRRFLGIEKDPAYFAICEQRIAEAQAALAA